LSKESYCLCKEDYETEEEVRGQQRVVNPLVMVMMMMMLMMMMMMMMMMMILTHKAS
jgi:hypothetical protein